MARGKATPASFVKGDPRASMAGKKSSRALPQDLKDARMLNANVFEQTFYKYMFADFETLKEVFKTPGVPSVDLIVIKIIIKAIETGDYQRLNFLLERTVGKVADKIEAKVGILTVHDLIMQEIDSGSNK